MTASALHWDDAKGLRWQPEEDQPVQAFSCPRHALKEVSLPMPASSSSVSQRAEAHKGTDREDEIFDCRLPREEAQLAAPELRDIGKGRERR